MSERIYFHNITDSKLESGIQINRAYPAVLSGSMNRDEWLDVCNKIDDSVDAINKGISNSNRILMVTSFIVVFGLAAGVVSLVIDRASKEETPYYWNNYREEEAWKISPRTIVILCLAVAVLPVPFCLFCRHKRQGKEALHNIEHVFEDLNRMKPNVTFHFIDSKVKEGLCVEIVVDNFFNPGAGMAAIPGGGVGGDFEERDPATRLETLESMRAGLTVEEYEAKRRQILNSV
jgi:hypothetical protein